MAWFFKTIFKAHVSVFLAIVISILMPRKPRIEYVGAVYHVMSRGNRQGEIYRDDTDRELFLETLTEVCAGQVGLFMYIYF